MLKIGDKVQIYEDPVTQNCPEGMATLRELYRKCGQFTHWRVEFDDANGEFYERTIYGEETEVEASE